MLSSAFADLLERNLFSILTVSPSSSRQELRRRMDEVRLEMSLGLVHGVPEDFLDRVAATLGNDTALLEHRLLAEWSGDPLLDRWAHSHDVAVLAIRRSTQRATKEAPSRPVPTATTWPTAGHDNDEGRTQFSQIRTVATAWLEAMSQPGLDEALESLSPSLGVWRTTRDEVLAEALALWSTWPGRRHILSLIRELLTTFTFDANPLMNRIVEATIADLNEIARQARETHDFPTTAHGRLDSLATKFVELTHDVRASQNLLIQLTAHTPAHADDRIHRLGASAAETGRAVDILAFNSGHYDIAIRVTSAALELDLDPDDRASLDEDLRINRLTWARNELTAIHADGELLSERSCTALMQIVETTDDEAERRNAKILLDQLTVHLSQARQPSGLRHTQPRSSFLRRHPSLTRALVSWTVLIVIFAVIGTRTAIFSESSEPSLSA